MENKKAILNLLGLATRARKIVLGEGMVLQTLTSSNQNLLVFLADDAGKNITKKIGDKAEFYNHTVFTGFSSDELSNAIGNKNRKVVLVIDKGFIEKFKKLYYS